MTRLWPGGDPIRVASGADGLVQSFLWRGAWHPVETVAACWRVRTGWWTGGEAWREYVKLTTTDGLLCTLYLDLHTGEWFCSRLYD